jgi:hypothetical protein
LRIANNAISNNDGIESGNEGREKRKVETYASCNPLGLRVGEVIDNIKSIPINEISNGEGKIIGLVLTN